MHGYEDIHLVELPWTILLKETNSHSSKKPSAVNNSSARGKGS